MAAIAAEHKPSLTRCRTGGKAVVFFSLLAVSAVADAGQLKGTVVGVSDGDTVTFVDEQRIGHKIRLSGIDAPEKNQPFGRRATARLAALVGGRQVTLETFKRDRYGRIVARVLVASAHCTRAPCDTVIDAGLEQVSAGYAWHYKQYQGEQTAEQRAAYALAEQHARAQHQGLWLDVEPTPPWAFRRSRRAAKTGLRSKSEDRDSVERCAP